MMMMMMMDGWSGLAGTHESWGPQIKGLVGTDTANEDERSGGGGDWNPIPDDNESGGGIEVCAFDNRGMGLSSVPTKTSQYTCVNIILFYYYFIFFLFWFQFYPMFLFGFPR
jgi:hypothetical protein